MSGGTISEDARGDSYVDPTRKAFDLFKSLPRDTPIEMLNLIRLKKHATYPHGHEFAHMLMTGVKAYGEYGKRSAPIFERVGGGIIWRGKMDALVIGPSDEHWDACFIATYPNSGAFLEMVTDPEYQKAVIHRQSAVQTSRLIRMSGLEVSGAKFA